MHQGNIYLKPTLFLCADGGEGSYIRILLEPSSSPQKKIPLPGLFYNQLHEKICC